METTAAIAKQIREAKKLLTCIRVKKAQRHFKFPRFHLSSFTFRTPVLLPDRFRRWGCIAIKRDKGVRDI